VPDAFKRCFIDVIAEILETESDQELASLQKIEPFRLYKVEAAWIAKFAERALREAFLLVAHRQLAEMTDSERLDTIVTAQTQVPEKTSNIYTVSDSVIPIQIFGAGFLLQSAALGNADKVMLFQFCDPFGLPIQLSGGSLLQIWITVEDLKHGRFDRIVATCECT